VLTSDNTWLGKQTADRFVNQLKGGPVVFNWEEWRNDRPKDFAESKLLPYIKKRGIVLVSTKNVRHLDNLLQVLKFAKASSVPTLIFDDEADNASLNTNEAKQSKKGKATVPDSSIFVKIGDIRKEVANHIYIQITATPQSLLLQNLEHPCKPVFQFHAHVPVEKKDTFFLNGKGFSRVFFCMKFYPKYLQIKGNRSIMRICVL